VYGTKGALDLNLDRPEEEHLRACLGRGAESSTWVPVKCPKVPNQHERFVASIRTGKQGQTSFAGGVKVQEYLEACFDSSRRNGAWTKI
jgi:predicted dehydrogenase